MELGGVWGGGGYKMIKIQHFLKLSKYQQNVKRYFPLCRAF